MHNIHALAEEFGDDVPTMDDFFGGVENKKPDADPNTSNQNLRKSMILP
jgi:hypothetical protein